MNKEQNVGILHGLNLYIYFQDICQTSVGEMIKSHI